MAREINKEVNRSPIPNRMDLPEAHLAEFEAAYSRDTGPFYGSQQYPVTEEEPAGISEASRQAFLARQSGRDAQLLRDLEDESVAPSRYFG